MGCCESRNIDKLQNTEQTYSSEEDDKENIKSFVKKNSTMIPELLYFFTLHVEGKGDCIDDVSIVDRGLTMKNVEMLCVLLKGLKKIRTLQLVNNSLNQKTFKLISEHFQFLPSLLCLNLSFNSMAQGGLETLVQLIHLLKGLKVLSLVSSRIQDEDKELVFKILGNEVCYELVSVDIRDNEFSFEVLLELVEFCSKAAKVKVFLLENHTVGKSGMESLKDKAKGLTLEEDY